MPNINGQYATRTRRVRRSACGDDLQTTQQSHQSHSTTLQRTAAPMDRVIKTFLGEPMFLVSCSSQLLPERPVAVRGVVEWLKS